jgi:hypothetical protein
VDAGIDLEAQLRLACAVAGGILGRVRAAFI